MNEWTRKRLLMCECSSCDKKATHTIISSEGDKGTIFEYLGNYCDKHSVEATSRLAMIPCKKCELKYRSKECLENKDCKVEVQEWRTEQEDRQK